MGFGSPVPASLEGQCQAGVPGVIPIPSLITMLLAPAAVQGAESLCAPVVRALSNPVVGRRGAKGTGSQRAFPRKGCGSGLWLGFASSGFLMAGRLGVEGAPVAPGVFPLGPRKQRNESICSRLQAHS